MVREIRIPVEEKQMRVEQLAILPKHPDEYLHGRDVEQQTNGRECVHQRKRIL
jgi:hypothetical protein